MPTGRLERSISCSQTPAAAFASARSSPPAAVAHTASSLWRTPAGRPRSARTAWLQRVAARTPAARAAPLAVLRVAAVLADPEPAPPQAASPSAAAENRTAERAQVGIVFE